MHGRPMHVTRIRGEVRGLFGDPALARRIEDMLRQLDGVVSVRASPRTGRVLVRLAPDASRSERPEPSVSRSENWEPGVSRSATADLDLEARVLQAMGLLAHEDAPPPPSLR